MNTHYYLIFVTNLPSFYKINLLNRLALKRKILVVFTDDHSAVRNEDFYTGSREFPFVSIADRSTIGKCLFIRRLLRENSFDHLLVSGWNQLEYWIAAFTSIRAKNAVIVESSIYESSVRGIKGVLKRILCSRFSQAFVPGRSQGDLLKALGFSGELIVTKGVGIFNIRPQPEFTRTSDVKNFIYVGRLSPEKNLTRLIETFNRLPELTLNIVGFGPQEHELKSLAGNNIVFHGAVPNAELYKLYRSNDVFILPSLSEPWGIVVEEALNNGLPVIVSDKVGCAEEIVTADNGIVFPVSGADTLRNAVMKMKDLDFYNRLRMNISHMDFVTIAENQLHCYL